MTPQTPTPAERTAGAADTAVDTRIRRRLLTARALRSVAQGALVVTFPLYLDALGWSGTQIGALFTAIAVLQASLTLFSGPLSDHLGRRRFLRRYWRSAAQSAGSSSSPRWPAASAAA